MTEARRSREFVVNHEDQYSIWPTLKDFAKRIAFRCEADGVAITVDPSRSVLAEKWLYLVLRDWGVDTLEEISTAGFGRREKAFKEAGDLKAA